MFSPFRFRKFPTLAPVLSAFQRASLSTARSCREPSGSLLVSNWLLVYLSMRDLVYIQELCSLLYLWWGAYSFMPEPCIQIHMLLSHVPNVLWTLNSLSFHSMLLICVSASRALSWFSYLALPAYLLVTLSFCSRKKLWTSAFSSLCLECPCLGFSSSGSQQ